MSFAFADRRPRRRPSLTPMIDVVFLLLVFFLVVARFGAEGAVPVAPGGGGAGYSGPPRLVEVRPGALSLNGVAVTADTLVRDLARLAAGREDPVILRARDGASLQDLVDALELLRRAGHARLVVAE